MSGASTGALGIGANAAGYKTQKGRINRGISRNSPQ